VFQIRIHRARIWICIQIQGFDFLMTKDWKKFKLKKKFDTF
jgi:hypothetical protein